MTDLIEFKPNVPTKIVDNIPFQENSSLLNMLNLSKKFNCNRRLTDLDNQMQLENKFTKRGISIYKTSEVVDYLDSYVKYLDITQPLLNHEWEWNWVRLGYFEGEIPLHILENIQRVSKAFKLKESEAYKYFVVSEVYSRNILDRDPFVGMIFDYMLSPDPAVVPYRSTERVIVFDYWDEPVFDKYIKQK